MNNILIAKNIIKRVLRGPKEIITIILMPVVLISIIVIALGGVSGSITKAGILELDNGFYATTMVDYIKKQNVEVVKLNQENYEASINQRKVGFVVIIPKNFSSDINEGKIVEVDFYDVNMDSNTQSIKQLINQYVQKLYRIDETAKIISQKTSQDKTEIIKNLITETEREQLELEYKLSGKSSNEMNTGSSALGFTIMFMMILIFTTIGIILEDKKKLTLARMFVSPVREYEIIIGNLLGSLALGLLQLIPLTVVFKIAFKIDTLYKLAAVFIVLFCFLISIIGIGIGISGLIKQSLNPATLIAAVITPSSLIGGCFIPESMLPDFINKIGYAVPQKWVMKAVESILLGEGFQSIALNLVIILMFGLAFATFGLKTLRPMNE